MFIFHGMNMREFIDGLFFTKQICHISNDAMHLTTRCWVYTWTAMHQLAASIGFSMDYMALSSVIMPSLEKTPQYINKLSLIKEKIVSLIFEMMSPAKLGQ